MAFGTEVFGKQIVKAKEHKHLDFVIASEPLTDEARQEISAFIRDYKNTFSNKRERSKAGSNQKEIVQVGT